MELVYTFIFLGLFWLLAPVWVDFQAKRQFKKAAKEWNALYKQQD